MSFFIQVLCTDSIDSTACTIIGTDSYRIIINCGEGVQRLCVEHKVRLGKICAVLFTDDSPSHCFGLPGMALTLSEAGNSKILVAGPAHIRSLLTATRHFMKLPDQLLQLDYTNLDSPDIVTIIQNKEVTIQKITMNSNKTNFCYLGSSPALPGKFDIKKAQALNIPKGELFGKLKSGKAVTLADGTEIQPDQVLGESEPSKHFLIVCNISSKDDALIDALIENSEINRYRQASIGAGEIHCIVHLSSAATVSLERYQCWMRSFGIQTTHILSGAGVQVFNNATRSDKDICTLPSAFLATTVQCNKMHHAEPQFFPHLHSEYPLFFPGQSSAAGMGSIEKLVMAVPGMRFTFLPLRSHGVSGLSSDTNCTEFALQLWNKAVQGDDSHHITSALQELRSVKCAAVATTECSINQNMQQQYGFDSASASLLRHSCAKLSFLGTGCAIPSKYRNVSGILLDLSPSSAILIDAGEGTWSQMLRQSYDTLVASSPPPSLSALSRALAEKLRVVWISHPHADHHLGLVRVIAERRTAMQDSQVERKLVVIAPASVLAFLAEYASLYPDIADAYIGVSCRDFDPDDDCKYTDAFWNNNMLDRINKVTSNTDQFALSAQKHHDNKRIETDAQARKRQKSEDSDGQISTVSEMDCAVDITVASSTNAHGPVEEHLSAVEGDDAAVSSTLLCAPTEAGLGAGGRSWRNFKAVFREEVSPAVRNQARLAMEFAVTVLRACGVLSLQNVQVVHCGQSYGLSLEFTDSVIMNSSAPISKVIKLVYSGDTRPCERLVALGQGATVLIHEATFDSDKQSEAVSKRHSTTTEAAEVGRQMGAYRVIFTHFSQRYPGVPNLAETCTQESASIIEDITQLATSSGTRQQHEQLPEVAPILAFDFMQVQLRDLLWAPALTAVLAAAYPIGSCNSLTADKHDGDDD